MLKVLLIVCVAQVVFCAVRRAHAEEQPKREQIEWCDVWITNADRAERPKVLLIGDSITRAYYGEVEKALAGKADVARLATSKALPDPALLDEVEMVLKQCTFSVIHVNNGLHGWGYSEAQFKESMPKLIALIRRYAGDAPIIWAMTTPMRKKEDLKQFAPQTERVKERNRIAAEFTTAEKIPVDDLFSLVENHPEYYGGDGVHFNNQGQAAQGKQVAEIVLKHLPAK
jgi:hypothetical protein